ncbi:AraC family transcriptional regulator [Metabacillus litoralis]|uniref:AraC family transcriptional regulator n=1 Tax=Metabacillus litoralis TaxID=152268 RepID=UPI001CFE6632|nr:AraC family transcriptional regulator [Metabacillus litoralis]
MQNLGIAISMVYPIMKTLVHKGYDSDEFFRHVMFNKALLQDIETRIPGEEFEQLMISAAAFTKDEYFGLHQGQIMDFADMGILGYVMLHSKTIGDALLAYQRYNVILCSGFNLEWVEQDDKVFIRLFTQHSRKMSRHCVEDMASSLYRLLSTLSNQHIPLHEVQFTHSSPGSTDPYLSFFGITPMFNCKENSLCMSSDVLTFDVLYSDPKLLLTFETIAQENKDELTNSHLFTNEVTQWMKNCIPSYFPNLEETAKAFGVSIRTLQNKLKAEETSFNDLSTKVRKELAINLLRKKEYSVAEIAYLLHYSEPSVFHHAFKKWTGLTPGRYREEM